MQDLKNYLPKMRPGKVSLIGQYIRVEPLDWDLHADGLEKSVTGSSNAYLWEYIPLGPFDNIQGYKSVMDYVTQQFDWQRMCLISQENNTVLGTASFMRLRPQYGSAEIGCVVFGKDLQKTKEATEANYLMARHLFDDLGYRRYEWKCNNINEASKKAATRLGFKLEGVFRNDMVVKGHNRDTAWFSITDQDWITQKLKFENWLSKDNFDSNGKQKRRLQDCI